VTGLSATNYTFTPANGSLDITRVALTVTADAQSKPYDGSVFSPFTSTITGYVNNETLAVVTGTPTYSGAATTAVNYGAYTITPVVTGLSATNYTFTPANGSLNITRLVLTVTADTKSKVYGETNSALTIKYSGWQNGDNEAKLTTKPVASTLLDATSSVGVHSAAITVAGGVAADYSFLYIPADYEITRALLIITADAQTKIYGEANDVLTFKYSGWQNGDDESKLTTKPVASTLLDKTSPVAVYANAITVASGVDENYRFSYVAANYEITKALQTIIFGSLSAKVYGNSDYAPGATASSGLTVTYASSNTSVATIVDGKIHLVGKGISNITASQSGNSDYREASDEINVLTVSAPAIAGDTNGDGKITAPEIAGDINGDGKITASEIAGDINGDGKITAPEIAGDNDGDGKITFPEIVGDINGDGKITFPEIAGDINGDGKITFPEIAGDTNGDGKITAPEIAGDTNGDGKITAPEIAGDINGDGKIIGSEIAGDINGDGKITAPEIAGDINVDGKIIFPEIAGDTNGNGKIDGTEVTEVTVCTGSTIQLTGLGIAASVNPWVSAMPGVASISSNGLVTGVSVGSSVITYTNSNGYSQSVTVNVNPQPVISGGLSVTVGSTNQLTGSGDPAATNAWSSSNAAVGTVNSNGIVTGVSSGTFTVTYTDSSGFSQSVSITVLPATPVITLSAKEMNSSASQGNQWYYSATENGEGVAITGAMTQNLMPEKEGWYWTVVTQGVYSSEPSLRKYRLPVDSPNIYNLYPVPNDGQFTLSIKTSVKQTFDVAIYNQLGQKVYELHSVDIDGEFTRDINLRPAASGVYLITIQSEKGREILKMNIEN
ncbi:MAG: MBG domain-containing protein, partial [Mariniphaga sp.]